MSSELEAWAAREVPRLLEEVRDEALAEARERLRARMVQALLEAAERPAPAPAPPEAAGELLWLHGVVTGAPPAGLEGLEGPVTAVEAGGLCALVSRVPAAQYGPGALERRLEDLPTLERLARDHERVLEAVMAGGPVVPVRIGTVYGDEEGVRRMLERDGPALRRALSRLEGRTEWGVKVLWTAADGEAAEAAEPASGADYLARKRFERRRDTDRRAAVETHVAAIHDALAAHAEETVLSRPQNPELSGHEGEMVLNAALLVPDDRLDAFRAELDRLADEHRDAGLEIVLTGPWPAYHFAAEAA